jgi:hypothetical protein
MEPTQFSIHVICLVEKDGMVFVFVRFVGFRNKE